VMRRVGDEGLTLEVRDTGVGIPADQLPAIFERFHRVPNARSRTHEGTGIGLALVQELVRLHGGTIDVESTEGKGSTFTVRIPAGSAHLPRERIATNGEDRPAALGAAPFVEEALRWLPDHVRLSPTSSVTVNGSTPAAPGDRPTEPASDSPRILLADDNADMRHYVARLLRTQGWRVDAVQDGRAALEH